MRFRGVRRYLQIRNRRTTNRGSHEYSGRLFATTDDHQTDRAEEAGLGALRRSPLAAAAGHVPEIGGTGANLTFYRPEVESLTAGLVAYRSWEI